MKKLTFIVVALGFYAAGIAQVEDQLSIGPRLGVNISNATNVTNSESKTGLAFGATSTYSFTESMGVTVDLLYSGEGFGHSISDSKFKLGYLLVPIYFDYFFGKLGTALRPKLYVGVAPAFLLSAKQDDDDEKDEFNSINFSFSAGGGVNYRLSDKVWLNTDIRAFIGLTDLRDKALQDDINVNSRNVQVSVGVAYGLSKL